MSKGRLQHVIDRYRQQLRDHESAAERALAIAHNHTLAVLQPHLDALYKQIAALQASGEDIPVSWLYERDRLNTIKHLIEKDINGFGGFAYGTTIAAQSEGARLGTASGSGMLDASVPSGVHYVFGKPSLKAIHNIVGATQSGSPLASLFSGYGDEAATQAGQVLATGLMLGYGPRVVARNVQHALGISRDRALTTARTEMLRAYRSAALETYRANSDVVDKWRWTCDMSIRTCIGCIAMDGTLHDLSESLDEHCNGRCTPVPVTKSWSDILGPLGIDTSEIPDTSLVDDMQSGADWFSEQDDATQKSILGARYSGWKAGDFTLSDMVGHDDDPVWGGSIYVKPLKELVK